MRRLAYVGGLALFCCFWLVSTPVYFVTTLLEWADRRLSRLLDELWDGL